ncbi:MAG: YtxH domain-containing protein [Bacteroidales bacterium]|nr:YtxH domain-containing protein [Bacteroidales bacterium]
MKTESLLGFIFGAAVGAVAGILFAPAKGEETRKKLMEAAAEGYEEVKEDFDELTHDAHVRYRYARIEAGKLKKQLMEQGGELKEDARKALLAQIEKLEAALAKEEKEETLAEEQA